ncbi:hypothetical protein B1H18_29095 [Streptomyces tsukubensis]|uniref:DUF397 domain-containing protein n=1 Tax=Streptomyces tsukubensis TaxID=83656 RepID=A0A1V4A270_9ACTN|nr:DUF397 domain-containing protein [Streptomyces tsukubensis]OON72663.1 hypothetical protein B1H18_29095 [Streptomyces tsukubensis]
MPGNSEPGSSDPGNSEPGSSEPGNSEPVWFKSSYSAGDGGDCVEVAVADAAVRIRDSRRTDGPFLHVGAAEWVAFVRMAGQDQG